MTQTRFEELIDKFEGSRAEVLKKKNAKYAPDNDALHNFHTGARIDGSTTPQTIWHYMKKHWVALLDKVEKNDWSDMDDVFEKMGDIMNYMDFLWCAANEEHDKLVNNTPIDTKERLLIQPEHDCYDCKWGIQSKTDPPCATCGHNLLSKTTLSNWEPID